MSEEGNVINFPGRVGTSSGSLTAAADRSIVSDKSILSADTSITNRHLEIRFFFLSCCSRSGLVGGHSVKKIYGCS